MRRNLLVNTVLPAALAAAALLLTSGDAQAQRDSDTFRWQGRLAAGQTLEIRGVQGDVRAVPASGSEVEVVARKRGRRDDPADVEVRVVPHGDGLTVCAVYPTARRSNRENRCAPGEYTMNTDDNDVQVEFTVRVPAGVRLSASTVSGDVDVEDLAGYVDARSVSGNVSVVTSGAAQARTVSGRVRATLGSVAGHESLMFETVSGSVEVMLPAGTGARLRMSSVSGSLDSEFPMIVQGRMSPRSMEGIIGGGGPLLRLKTVSGSIRVRRGS